MMTTALSLYKRTDNLSESAPRIADGGNNTWGFKGGVSYDVPLHDNNNQQWRTVATGLVPIKRDMNPPGFIAWLNAGGRYRPAYPRLTYPDHAGTGASNGCPTSEGALRTYFIEPGEYFLSTQVVSPSLSKSFLWYVSRIERGTGQSSPRATASRLVQSFGHG